MYKVSAIWLVEKSTVFSAKKQKTKYKTKQIYVSMARKNKDLLIKIKSIIKYSLKTIV